MCSQNSLRAYRSHRNYLKRSIARSYTPGSHLIVKYNYTLQMSKRDYYWCFVWLWELSVGDDFNVRTSIVEPRGGASCWLWSIKCQMKILCLTWVEARREMSIKWINIWQEWALDGQITGSISSQVNRTSLSSFSMRKKLKKEWDWHSIRLWNWNYRNFY